MQRITLIFPDTTILSNFLQQGIVQNALVVTSERSVTAKMDESTIDAACRLFGAVVQKPFWVA